MEFYEGMVIKIFPDTDRSAYKRMITTNGYTCTVRKGSIRIGRKIHEPIDKEAMARKFRKARKMVGMTREDVAKELNVNENTVYNWEIGRTFPNKTNLDKLRDLYRVDFKEAIKNEST